MHWLSIFNVAEAILWIALAATVFVRSRSADPSLRRLGGFLAVAFFAFAGTDLIEAKTGAWYRPWWLLLYNGACLIAIVACYVRYRSLKIEVPDSAESQDDVTTMAIEIESPPSSKTADERTVKRERKP